MAQQAKTIAKKMTEWGKFRNRPLQSAEIYPEFETKIKKEFHISFSSL
jgi:hypothetical protein